MTSSDSFMPGKVLPLVLCCQPHAGVFREILGAGLSGEMMVGWVIIPYASFRAYK